MRYQNFISIAIADVDYFKQFNDNYGHAKGDQVLIALANEIKLNLKRPYDLVSRYGGEEFGIVLPKISPDKAYQLCETIRIAVERLNIAHEFSLVSKKITISIGGTTLIPQKYLDLSTIVEKADLQLFEAKNKGRNRVEWTEENYLS
jgi:diguanylate cyclase (GGDEF)-like protein